MSVRVFAITCGWIGADLGQFLEGESGQIRIPVPSWLIEHPKGRLLFDSGLHPTTQTDPGSRLRGLVKIFDIQFAPGEEIDARLAALDVDASAVPLLINSHLHFDHAGGNARLPNARLLVQRREWEAGQDPDQAKANAMNPEDYDLGHDLLLVDGEHDVFGDGSVVCLPTHGHTPGHQSLRVALDTGPVILTADACYMRRTLEHLQLPPFAHDREQALDSLRRLRELQARGARLIFGHDPELWDGMPQAPAPII